MDWKPHLLAEGSIVQRRLPVAVCRIQLRAPPYEQRQHLHAVPGRVTTPTVQWRCATTVRTTAGWPSTAVHTARS